MPKVALNFICKNESHVVWKMLESAGPIVDLIVAGDTGSTDGTQELIRQFGQMHNIPAYVFERPFDDFSSSRNYALQKLREVVGDCGWSPKEMFVLWLDCDEYLIITSRFNKAGLTKDAYWVNVTDGNRRFSRQEFFRLSKGFYWYGPVHETITNKDLKVSTGRLDAIQLVAEETGRSWQGDLAEKHRRYARIMEEFVENTDYGYKWVFTAAHSFNVAARYCLQGKEHTTLLDKAIHYYEEVVKIGHASPEHQFVSQLELGTIQEELQYPWPEIQQAFLKAYAIDPLRGESIKKIIFHYIQAEEWNLAYVFTRFSRAIFFNRNPYPERGLLVDEAFYNWQVLDLHTAVCLKMGKSQEGKAAYEDLFTTTRQHPDYFKEAEVETIRANWSALSANN